MRSRYRTSSATWAEDGKAPVSLIWRQGDAVAISLPQRRDGQESSSVLSPEGSPAAESQAWEREQVGTLIAHAPLTQDRDAGRSSFLVLALLGAGLAHPHKGKRSAQHGADQEASQVAA